MDSINRQQTEENHEDLQGIAGIKKLKELIGKANSCFFCTRLSAGAPLSTRPMSVQTVDDQGILWFLSATDSEKNSHIATDPVVQLFFQGSAYSDFLTLTGRATISTDKEKIKELWEPLLKTWFTEGIDDSRISVIQFIPDEGYYWDTKNGNLVAFAKQLVGAAIGKTMDDSIEGRISR